MRVRRKTVVKLLLMASSLGVALLFAEFAVRMLLPQTTMYPRYVDSPDYPFALPANASIVHAQGRRWRFEYNTNRLGHRGPYLAPIEADQTTRVVSLGDSFTFGVGVNDDEVYTNVLSKLLGPGFTVINGGMGGWGIDSEIKWFFMEEAPYRPRIVTLQFAANDPFDFFGVTRVQDGKLTFHSNPNIRPGWQLRLSRSYLLQSSHLYAALRSIYGRSTARGRSTPGATDELPGTDPGEERYAEMLRLFVDTLQAQGSSLLFVSVTHGHADGSYHYDIDHFPRIKEEVTRLQAAGLLQFVDLPLTEMKEFPGSPEGHQWSAPHHRAVALAIAEEIRSVGKFNPDQE